jgi:hypothetical protein
MQPAVDYVLVRHLAITGEIGLVYEKEQRSDLLKRDVAAAGIKLFRIDRRDARRAGAQAL